MDEEKSDTYLLHSIQNECILLMASQILCNLSKKIWDSGCFTPMRDECTDISNKEQLTVCLRWVDHNLQDHENFIGFYEVKDITAETFTSSIKDALLQVQIDISMCCGQCYDGASNMSGAKNGVVTQIASTNKRGDCTCTAMHMH